MRKVNLGDIEKKLVADGYRVFVRYIRPPSTDNTPEGCRAVILQEDNEIAVGDSYCHPNDNFWKKKGRHIAVCSAAKSAGLI